MGCLLSHTINPVITFVITMLFTKVFKVITLVITMKTTIRKIGNSLGILLPKDVLDLMGLKEGDVIDVTSKNKKMNITLEKKTK